MVELKHPPTDQLVAFGQGRLSIADSDSIERHIADCESCQLQVDTAPDDMLVRLVKSSLPTDPIAALSTATTRAEYCDMKFFAKGGLGEVMLAHDRVVGRDVAVKRLLPDRADDPNRRKRFLREAAITGRLEHPGIAPVYGIGEDENGRPCYAMRFVPGKTLRDVVGELHAVRPASPGALRPVLSRFVSLCATAAYAHSRGVVHRDIKPANVAVGPFGETILLDWGLAQSDRDSPEEDRGVSNAAATAFDRYRTETGWILGTPGFMSPEQRAGERVGPAADIYSLGATLKVILTGREPAVDLPENRAFAALHAIVRRATAAQPLERYATAVDLAADVERWLADEPVTAFADPPMVRLRRLVRRHRTAAISALALLLTATIGLAVSTVLLDRERRKTVEALSQRSAALTAEARQRELAERAEAATLAEFRASTDDIIGNFLGTNASFGPAERAFLNNLLQRWQRFSDRQVDDVRGLRAEAQRRVGQLWRRLGQLPEARAAFAAARDGYETLAVQQPQAVSIERELGLTCTGQAIVLRELDAHDDARAACERAIHVLNSVVGKSGSSADRRELAAAHSTLALVLKDLGKFANAVSEFELARQMHRSLVAADPVSSAHRKDLADVEYNLGVAHIKSKSFDLAHAEFTSAGRSYERLAAENPGIPEYQLQLARTHNSLGFFATQNSHPELAISELRLAAAGFEKLAAGYPSIPSHVTELAKTRTNLGLCLHSMGNPLAARAEYQAARDALHNLCERFPQTPEYRNSLARACLGLGVLLQSMDLRPAASIEFQSAALEYRRLAKEQPNVAEYIRELANCAAGCGDNLRIVGKLNDSLIWYDECIQNARAARAKDANERARLILGVGLVGRAQVYDQLGQVDKADRDWEQALQIATPSEQRGIHATRARARAGR